MNSELKIYDKDEILSKFNELDLLFSALIKNIEMLSKERLYMPNVAIVFQNKMFEIEGIFKHYNIDCFSDSELYNGCFNHLMNIVLKSQGILEDMEIRIGNMYYINNSVVADPLISKKIEEYEKISDIVSNFSISKDILLIVEKMVKNSEFNYENKLSKIILELQQIDLNDTSLSIENLKSNIQSNQVKKLKYYKG